MITTMSSKSFTCFTNFIYITGNLTPGSIHQRDIQQTTQWEKNIRHKKEEQEDNGAQKGGDY